VINSLCYICKAPAVAFINTSVNCASSVPLHMEPVCASHDPYGLSDMVMVSRKELERLQRLDVTKD
jgi:hypothetical protein